MYSISLPFSHNPRLNLSAMAHNRSARILLITLMSWYSVEGSFNVEAISALPGKRLWGSALHSLVHWLNRQHASPNTHTNTRMQPAPPDGPPALCAVLPGRRLLQVNEGPMVADGIMSPTLQLPPEPLLLTRTTPAPEPETEVG